MYTVENHVGRLMEVRVESTATLQDVQTLSSKVYALLARMDGPAVFCSDFRTANALPSDVADRFANAYRVANAKVLRTAVLVVPTSVFRLQFERIVREAGSPARRVFQDGAAAESWLGEVLTDEEKRRLREFVAARP